MIFLTSWPHSYLQFFAGYTPGMLRSCALRRHFSFLERKECGEARVPCFPCLIGLRFLTAFQIFRLSPYFYFGVKTKYRRVQIILPHPLSKPLRLARINTTLQWLRKTSTLGSDLPSPKQKFWLSKTGYTEVLKGCKFTWLRWADLLQDLALSSTKTNRFETESFLRRTKVIGCSSPRSHSWRMEMTQRNWPATIFTCKLSVKRIWTQKIRPRS